jgi:hypothetical protein
MHAIDVRLSSICSATSCERFSKASRHWRTTSGDSTFCSAARTPVCSGGSISLIGLLARHAPGLRMSLSPDRLRS